jgi:DNA-binding NarL/FixJ family response regulator
VRNRVSIIFDKLGVSTRPKAIVWARDAGFGRKAPDA